MEYVRLGSTGLKVSRICLGCMTYGAKKWREWVLEEEESRPFFQRAIELGINFFDTADMLLARRERGDHRARAQGVRSARPRGHRHQGLQPHGRRSEPARASPASTSIIRSTRACAGSARTTWTSIKFIASITIRRLKRRCAPLDDVVRAGKALYIGASSMHAYQFAKMLHASDTNGLARFVSMQNHYNLVYREEEREMLPLCREEGIGVIPWSPLARGFLVGNRRAEDLGDTLRAKTDDYAQKLYYQSSDFEVVKRVTEIAGRRGVPNAQVALAWVLQQPGITSPIVGASKMRHLDDAVAALSVKLEPAELKALSEPYQCHPVLGHS